MTAEELLTHLAHQGIELWLDGDNLRYRGPKITLPPGLVALLRQHKAQLRELLLANRQVHKDLFPLSYTQKSMWFLHQVNPSSSAYNIHIAAKLTGSLSAPALQTALDKLGARHHALRIRYVVRDGLPWQQVEAKPSIPLMTVDASGWTDAELMERVRTDADRPYDLLGEPPARVHLYQHSPIKQILLIGMHHIRVDGWSMAILVRELGALYRSEISGQPVKLPPLAADFSDFVAWQQWLVQSSEGNTQLAYWTKELGGELPPLELPTDRPRPPVRSERGSAVPWSLDATATRRLRTLASAEGATAFSFLLSAFAALLQRYTGQEDLLIGTPYHGRSMTKWNDLVGCLINTVVMHVRSDGGQSILGLLREVNKKVNEALTHADYPFTRLVEKLRPERDLSRTPVFQVLFAYENFRGAEMLSPIIAGRSGAVSEEPFGVPLSPLLTSQQEGLLDLSLSLIEEGGGLRGSFSFSTDLFERETIVRFVSHFDLLLRSALDEPEVPIARLPLLLGEERQRVLFDWNPEPPAPQAADTFPQRFREQVERTPEALALGFGGQSLTYRALFQRASQLAHLLSDSGVSPLSRVALCLDRSLDLVIGILAIWLSGGTYVPLDLRLPTDRTAFQLRDSSAVLILTQQRHSERLSSHGIRLLFVDDPSVSTRPTSPPPLLLSPGQLAYCIYTSGSTGRPRGVLVEHASLIHLARTLHAALLPPSIPPLRATLSASVTFDASILMLTLLLRGDFLHIVPDSARGDASMLVAWSREQRIDLFDCTPSLLSELVSQGFLSEEAHVPAWLWVGGEAIPDKLWTRLQQAPRTHSINLYGPTECTVLSTLCEVGPGPSRPIIGRPYGHVRTYVLDAQLQPVPVGVFGELFLSGPGVARGYLNLPALTAQKFLSDPFHPGQRMYRSGDRARFLPDGNIEFVGRLDFQVKLRGFRIELGEIESVLATHPGISSCTVLLREDSPGDKRLVAYFVPSSALSPDSRSLRSHLASLLPEYMLPSAFVRLSSLPLTSSGKLDRRALPPPSVERSTEEQLHPSSPIEQLLTDVFREVLRREHIPLSASFFDLGGHSLLAMQLVSRLRKLCEIELPVQAVFESPTLGALAERIRAALAGGLTPLPPVRSLGRSTQVRMSFAQQRLWLLQALDPESCTYNIPMQWKLAGTLDIAALQRSLDALTERHEVLRARVLLDDQEPQLRILPHGHWPLQQAEVSSAAEAERVLREQARRPFALEAEPPVRATLVHLSDSEYWLQLNVHHMAFDGWSRPILLRELDCLYEAERAGRAAELPELELQYADYAEAQRAWLAGGLRDDQLAYWKQQLVPLPELLELPTDRLRPGQPSGAGAWSRLTLDEKTTSSLKALCRREGATPFMALLAAYAITLSRYTGQKDFAIGTPVAGRPRIELEPIIGCFINTLVLRADLSGAPCYLDLLKRIKDKALGAYSHAEVPFELLVEELNPPRDTGRTPFFQVMFLLQSAEEAAELRLPGVRTQAHLGGSATAKFELTLGMWESAGCLSGIIEYSTDLFDADTIERFAQHFCNVVRAAVTDPVREISRLEMLSEQELHLLLVKWNQTEAAYPKDSSLVDLFEARAQQSPEAIALVFGSQHLSYRELDLRANQLAHRLRALGVRPEVLVGLCFERSFEMVIGLLGILKAGGAYVPLDPALPAERLAHICSDAQISLLLTRSLLKARLPMAGTRILCPYDAAEGDGESALLSAQPTSRLPAAVRPENLAYVMYTSGSTGRPKGVMIPHRGLVNYLWWCQTAYPVTGGQGAPVHSTLSFDLTVTSLWAPLLAGREVHLLPAGAELDALKDALLRNQDFSLVKLTPAHLDLLSHMIRSQDAAGKTRSFVIGGENLLANQVSFWRDNAPDTLLFNEYGPTETVVGCCVYQIKKEDPRDGSIPIGRPIANTKLYVLDDRSAPVPVGVPGELCIGGIGVSRGYLNQPELSAQRFVPDPFSTEPGARMYRTGDRCRYRIDGNLEYLGRLDQQVKLRGFRIELGEIESVLATHPGISSCTVLLREDSPGDKRLVAYFVPSSALSPDSRSLRSHLASLLPEYMLPSAFVSLDSMPLGPNGKLDRKALPSPSVDPGAKGYVAPRTEGEQLVAAAFAQVLDLQRAGLNDSFFDLGGHSLLVLRLAAELSRRTGQNVPFSLVFEHPTVAELAQELEKEGALSPHKTLVLLHPAESSTPLFCVHPVGGHVLCYVELASSFQPPQRVYGLQATPVAQAPAAETLSGVASRYVETITSVQPHGPYQLLGWSLGGVLAFEMARQLKRAGQEVSLLALLDSYAPFEDPEQDVEAYSEDEMQRWFLRNLSGERLGESDAEPFPEDMARLQRALSSGPSMESRLEDRYEAQLAALYALFRRNVEMERSYNPDPYDGRVLLLRAAKRPTTRSRDSGWAALCKGELEIVDVPGDHYTLLSPAHIPGLAQLLDARLIQQDGSAERDAPGCGIK